MEHEVLDTAPSRDGDEVSLQQPQQFLCRRLVGRIIGSRHFAYRKGVLAFLVAEHDTPTTVSGFEPSHASRLGGNLGAILVDADPMPLRRILRAIC
jgi:hypothetical protein